MIEKQQQEQIEVVIRIKPQAQMESSVTREQQKCVYLSKNNKDELVVQTPSKKEYFVFDDIANQNCTQSQLFNKIGKSSLYACQRGYNCCLFAYGQTGAGKTYSILGDYQDLVNNIYAQSRGLLPRLLLQLFKFLSSETDGFKIVCSYVEIYNEQIFDLLNPKSKVKQIREDIKKGVFVEQLTQQQATSYENSIQVLLKGVKNRKIAPTLMNQQSSRSHTIFTIKLQYNLKDGDSVKIRKSKIHIVDLAGSQRAKLSKVEGERLKQGCNINKSLHILGNVINALVQSSKKKKYIPYRDSKLTYFLKDSLGGNSITKLLANIQPSKKYLGDTLSTLMFAKRAKIIRTKVQVNQQTTQTYEQLRKQIRKLRQELAQARFIQNQTKIYDKTASIDNSDIDTWQNWKRLQALNQSQFSQFDSTKNQKALDIFQQNQLQYKSLIEIYQEHIKFCSDSLNIKMSPSKKGFNIHNQWKSLQKKNQALTNLFKSFPAFTRIFKENLCLKSDLIKNKKQEAKKQNKNAPPPTPQPASIKKNFENIRVTNFDPVPISPQLLVSKIQSQNLQESQAELNFSQIKQLNRGKSLTLKSQYQQNNNFTQKQSKQQLKKVIQYYEKLFEEIEQKTIQSINKLQIAYNELLKQNQQKDQKIKQLRKRNNLPPDVQKLINQNQYLKLNILQLEEQISCLEKTQTHNKIKIKNLKQQIKKQAKNQRDQDQSLSIDKIIAQKQKQWEKQKTAIYKEIIQKIEQIKKQAQQQIEEVQQDKNFAQTMMVKLKQQALRYKQQRNQMKKQVQYYLFINNQLQSRIRQQTDFPCDQKTNLSKSMAQTGNGDSTVMMMTLQLPSFEQFQMRRSQSRNYKGSRNSKSKRSQSNKRAVVEIKSFHYEQRSVRQSQQHHQKIKLSQLNMTSPKKLPPLNNSKNHSQLIPQSNSQKNSKSKSNDTSYMQQQIMQLHQQYGSQIEELKEKIKNMNKDIEEYQKIKSVAKEEFSKSIHQVINQYRSNNCSSLKNNAMRKSGVYGGINSGLKPSTSSKNLGSGLMNSPKLAPRVGRTDSFKGVNGNSGQIKTSLFSSQIQVFSGKSLKKKQSTGSFKQKKIQKEESNKNNKPPNPKVKF